MVVTALRLHKALIFPVPVDLISVTDPLTRDQANNVLLVQRSLKTFWKRIGLRSVEGKGFGPPVKNSNTYLDPSQLGTQ